MYQSIQKFDIPPPGQPPAFELLKSLLVKFLAPGKKSLVKCPAMCKGLSSNVSASGTRKKMRFGYRSVLKRKMGPVWGYKEKFASCVEYFIVDIDVGIFTGTFLKSKF